MVNEMTQPYSNANKSLVEPFYGKFWSWLKQFPQRLAQGSNNPPETSGSAGAAAIAASIGCMTMMITHHISDADKSKTVEKLVHSLGSWIPGSHNPDPMWGNIGSYTGKETMLLVGWLISWFILSNMWRNRQMKSKTMLFWFFTLMIAATAMSWHPLFFYLPLT